MLVHLLVPRGTLISKTSLSSSVIWQKVGEERTKEDQADKLKGVHCYFSSSFLHLWREKMWCFSNWTEAPSLRVCQLIRVTTIEIRPNGHPPSSRLGRLLSEASAIQKLPLTHLIVVISSAFHSQSQQMKGADKQPIPGNTLVKAEKWWLHISYITLTGHSFAAPQQQQTNLHTGKSVTMNNRRHWQRRWKVMWGEWNCSTL